MMKLAFCLFNYFPFGGLQRDFLRIARACRDRGHEIHVYTMHWDGLPETGFNLHLIPATGRQNHSRCQSFVQNLAAKLAVDQCDVVIGFNKMPYLDLYYAADVCYAARVKSQRGLLYRLLPRYRQWIALEQAVFARGNHTRIMLISAQQATDYVRYYQTEADRLHMLPPGIAKDRIAPADASVIRQEIRDAYCIGKDEFLLLMVGSGFKTKGLDRTLRGIAALPVDLRKRCRLIVLGRGDVKPFIKLARKLQVSEQVEFLGGRSDVPHFLLAADLLLHPSYHENTGTVLLEALVAGLPVMTVAACGYAHYVCAANAGKVLPEPFQQLEWNAALAEMLMSTQQKQWRQNALTYTKQVDIYSMPEKAADLIERVGCQRDILPA